MAAVISGLNSREFDACAEIAGQFPDAWSAEDFARAFDNPNALVYTAQNEGKVLGFAVIYYAADEGELELIAVDAAAHRQGIGRLLLEEFLKDAKELGIASLFLEVRESNSAARTFYEKIGFASIGKRKVFYRNPEEDAILYRLELC